MSYYKFRKEDIFFNVIETWPQVKFDINNNSVYYNNRGNISGAHVGNVGHIPTGCISLYELNIDRPSDSLCYPFVTKDGSFEAVGNVSVKDYASSFEYGDTITGSYPMSASIQREYFILNHGTNSSTGSHILALKNVLNHYQPMSPHYAFSGSLGNKSTQALTLIYVPSIFYGSHIRRGTVSLKFFISGTLAAEARDLYFNGELRQVSGTTYAQDNGDGSVAGVVLYTEGVIVLTGAWGLTEASYDFGAVTRDGQWLDFGAGANDGNTDVTPSASFSLEYEGVNYIPTLTMHTHAPKSKFNFSSNPTSMDYDSYSSKSPITGTSIYKENEEIELFNTVSSSFYKYDETFKHQTYISKIGIYDDKKNLIAIAKLANPIRKNTERDFVFKLKLDF